MNRARDFFGELARPLIPGISEILQHPDVGTSSGFPDGKVLPVGRRDGPAQLHSVYAEQGANVARGVDVQQTPWPVGRESKRPDALAIGCPVDGPNAQPVARAREGWSSIHPWVTMVPKVQWHCR